MNEEEGARNTLAEIAKLLQSEDAPPIPRVVQILRSAIGFGSARVAGYVVTKCGTVVQQGPFAGMRYVTRSLTSSFLPKLLGSYEAELHEIIYGLTARPYATVVNIGCGEGYYAVGLARLLPSARVMAFDTNPSAQSLCWELASINGLPDRVAIEGECTLGRLNALAGPQTLIFCDCEGNEAGLLDPQAVPGLAACDVLVELHDFIDKTISQQVLLRFAGSHHVQRIFPEPRDHRLYPVLQNMGQLEQFLAFWEARPALNDWAFMTVA